MIHTDASKEPSSFSMKVMNELLIQARILDVDVDSLIEFVSTQVDQMLLCPPNFNYYGSKERIWVLRGFYPGTPLFFKVIIIDVELSASRWRLPKSISPEFCRHTSRYYVKVTGFAINSRVASPFRMFSSKQLRERADLSMENAFFNAEHSIERLVSKKVAMPRCMSPKGMKILRFNKSKRRRKIDAGKSKS